MSQSQMINFNTYMMPVLIETLQQRVALFNQASQGTIALTTAGFTGDFLQSSFWASVASANRRVDRYATNADVTPIDMTQTKRSAVKIAGGFGPVQYEPSQMTWLEKPTAEGIAVITSAFADALISDQLNTAIAALVAAIANVGATVTNDVSASAGITQVALNNTDALFGDQSQRLAARVMTGAAYHALIGKNLVNAANLFQAQNVRVVDVLGKAIIVTDAAALYAAGSPNKSKVLTLQQNAAIVRDGGDIISNIETKNGKERIVTSLQMDYTFGLELLGYTWDETNGGKSPTSAELATGTNWDKTAASVKNTAGVLTIGDASL